MNIPGTDGQDDKSERGKQTERRIRRFQPNWQEAFPWVYYEEAVNKMFCKICQDNQEVSDPVSAYLFGGCCNFQIMSLQSHAKSRGHLNAEEAERTKSGCNLKSLTWSPEISSSAAVLPSSSASSMQQYQQFLDVQMTHLNSQLQGMPRMLVGGVTTSQAMKLRIDDDDRSVVYPTMSRPVTFQVGPQNNTNTAKQASRPGLDHGESTRNTTLSYHKMWCMFINAHGVSKACMALEDYQWICELDLAKGLDMRGDHTAKECKHILNFIARTETPKIRNAIENCKFFSVVCDTFSSAYVDMVVIYVKSTDKGKQWQSLLYVHPIDPCKNEPLLEVLSAVLSRELQGVAWRPKLIGVVYDRAMDFRHPELDEECTEADESDAGSVEVKTEPGTEHPASTSKDGLHQERIPQNVLSHRCLLHSIEEFVTTTIRSQPYDRIASECIRTVKHCCQDMFVEEEESNDKSWTDTRLSDMLTIMKNYSEIVTALKEDKCGTGDVLKTWLFIMYIHLLCDILLVLVCTYKTLREETTNIGVLFESISDAVDNLKKLTKRSGQHLCKVDKKTTFQDQSLDTSNTGGFDEERESLLTLLIDDLVSRLGDLHEDKMAAMAKLASLAQWPVDSEDLKDYADEDLLLVVKTYSKVLKRNGVDTDRCLMEWSQLKNHIRRRFSSPTMTSWKRIFPTCQGKCENILHVISFILTLPGQTVEVEKGYQHLKATKRNTKLTPEEVRDRLRIFHNTPDVGEFTPGPFLGGFQEEMSRDCDSPPKKMMRKVSKEEDEDGYTYTCSLNMSPME